MIISLPSSGFTPPPDPPRNPFARRFVDYDSGDGTSIGLTLTGPQPLVGMGLDSDQLTSITVMCEPDSANPLEVSFDSGVTWDTELSPGETKTWGDIGSGELINFGLMRLRGVVGTPVTFEVHGEY